MQHLNHQDYYLARAKAAHEAARRAVNPAIAAIHLDMADRYERAVSELQDTALPSLRIVQAA